MREEAEMADEKRLAAKIVAQAKVTAPRLATMSAISEHRNRWVTYKVRRRNTREMPTTFRLRVIELTVMGSVTGGRNILALLPAW